MPIEEGEEQGTAEPKDRRSILADALGGADDEDEEGFTLEGQDEPEDLQSAGEEPSEGAKEETEVSSPEAKTQEKDEPLLIAAPEGMDPEDQAEFEKLPPKTKQWLSKRYSDFRRDYTSKTTELARERQAIAQERQNHQYLGKLEHQHGGRLARKNVRFSDALNNALAWDHFIDDHGAAGLLQYVEAHGFDPEELIEARNGASSQKAQGGTQSYSLPPEVEQKLAHFEQFANQLTQTQRAQQFERTTSAFEKFKAETPLFRDPGTAERLERAMAPHVERQRLANPMGDPSDWLKRSYAYALADDPGLNALVSGAQKLQKIEAEQDRTKRALAASSATGGPGTGSLRRVPKDRRELLRAALEGRI